jgi:hypothetical protein
MMVSKGSAENTARFEAEPLTREALPSAPEIVIARRRPLPSKPLI